MLLPRRIVLLIALLIMGGFAALSPKAWAGSKRHHRHSGRLLAFQKEPSKYQTRTIVDDYCPPTFTSDLRPGKAILTSTCPPGCPCHVVAISLYNLKTAGPDFTQIKRVDLDFRLIKTLHGKLGSETRIFTTNLGPYLALVGQTNLIMKIQYMQGTPMQLHTAYTTLLLTTANMSSGNPMQSKDK